MTDLSYKPVRKGDIYCSPACGYKCTWAAYQLATRRAKALCKLLGPGWEPHVWENGGWHYKVYFGAPVAEHHLGLVEVYTGHDPLSYSIFLQTDPQIIMHGGSILPLIRKFRAELRKRAKELSTVAALLTAFATKG